jgi:hypothetical protein
MKTITKLILLAVLLAFIGCRDTKSENKGTISKVTVAFSGYGCESSCPFEVYSVDNNLNVSFYGGEGAYKNGYFKGKVSKEVWDSIQVRFDKFIVKGIDTTEYKKTDHPDVEFFIHDGFRKHKTRFAENTGKMTKEDLDILYWFKNIAAKEKLQSTDSLIFETTLQYIIPPKAIEK